MTAWQYDLLMIFTAGLLVLVNAFFVGAEFALVKIREGRIDEMVNERRPFASTASWLVERLDASLSACQLGITMAALNSSTRFLLRRVGIESASEHEIPHSEEEIHALLMQAHIAGELSRSEHRLINAVFEFDELICRRVMLPRADVVYLDVNHSLADALDLFAQTKHTRYPVCDGSLDKIVGVVHIKDMLGISAGSDFDMSSGIRPPQYVPETMPVRRLLRQFQSTRQHLAFLVDEYGTVSGIVTLDNILESIIGPVEDEFDDEQADIVSEGPQQYNISGNTSIDEINQRFGLKLEAHDVDTIAGLMMARTDKMLAPGEQVELPGAIAEVLEVRGPRALRIRLTLSEPPPEKTR